VMSCLLQLGQIKRLGGLEALKGMWKGDLQIDNGEG
jgi:hypothetical protein